MTDDLSALDATFLELEQQDEGALMHIGGVMVFDPLPGGGTPSIEQLCADLLARLITLPRYSQRLSTDHVGGLQWPHWVADDRFDIRAHIGHTVLPAPGGAEELAAWAADFYSHRLDRRRPLWEIVLVEGLEEGRWALAHKTHHCMVDGVGSVEVAYILLDAERAPGPASTAAPPNGHSSAGTPSTDVLRALVPSPPRTLAQAAQAGSAALRMGARAARHPRAAFERSRELAEVVLSNEVIAAPRTSLNVPIGSTRRYAAVTVPLEDLKLVRRDLGGSLNDAILAACTAGLRELLLQRGDPLPYRGLRAMVPMNVRAASEHLALGNRVSSLFVDLPVREPIPLVRYRRIMGTTRRLKASGAGRGASSLVELTALAPPLVHAALARSLYAARLFNVTITNVPGPQVPLYAFGARLREIQPIVPLAAAHAVGIAIFSYDGVLTFGLLADSESTPDLQVLASGVRAGVSELVDLAHRHTHALHSS